MEQYEMFLRVVGALGNLVVVATIVERVLAFIFEHEWFVRIFCKNVPDPSDSTKTLSVSKIPGLKGLLALALSLGISFGYRFDVLRILFATNENREMGMLVTGFVIAGGSAGAIAVFQSYLKLDKKSRDAIIAARTAQAESDKRIAELAAEEAQAKAEEAQAKQRKAKAEADAAEQAAS